MSLIDTHAHLYLDEFARDRAEVMERAAAEGVTKIFLPAIDHTVIGQMMDLEKAYPDTCKLMMGVHPCSVRADFRNELEVAEGWLKERPFAGIGEVGLDFYWDKSYIKEQYEAFEQQVTWGRDLHLPVIIHSRESGHECLDVIKKFQAGNLKGIFHCFSGDAVLARGIIDAGFFLGIGGVVTYKNAGLAQSLKDIPLEYMVLETDAPYLTPVPYRGKRNESGYLKFVVQKLAEIKSVPVETVAEITTANAQKIFGC